MIFESYYVFRGLYPDDIWESSMGEEMYLQDDVDKKIKQIQDLMDKDWSNGHAMSVIVELERIIPRRRK